MENNSLVTVNILSYNRKEELKNTLQKVYGQDYKNIEVIVVDNASCDGSAEMVRNDFPNAILIKMQKNIGIAGWNEGFKIAKGEYILVLDDDSYPDKDSITCGIETFKLQDELGILAYNIFNNRIEKSETEKFLEEPYFFVGCGAMIKKEVIEKVGLFNKYYFIYLHELDYSARCYNAGFKIKYFPDAVVYHNQNLDSRGERNENPFTSRYRYKNYFISYLIFLIQSFSLRFTLLYSFKWIANRFIIAVTYNYWKEFLHSLFHIIKNAPKYFKGRMELKKVIQQIYHNGNMPLFDPQYYDRHKKIAK